MDADPKRQQSYRGSHCRETDWGGREWFRCLPETHAAEIKHTQLIYQVPACGRLCVCVIVLFSLLSTSMWTACGVPDSSPGGSAGIVATHTSEKLTAYTLGQS